MKPIAVFHHCWMSGGDHPVNPVRVVSIVQEQLDALTSTGLMAAAKVVHFGVNGGFADECEIAELIADPKVSVVRNPEGVGELPTMKAMQNWAKANPGWNVLYHHAKGTIHQPGSAYDAWRRCMERACVHNWKACVYHLEHNFDSCGAHWLTPEEMPIIGPVAYWGGNFWWATSDFINTLPPIDIMANRYEAEVWIGKGPKRPRVKDFAHHFPTSGC
jgi:hypothetical protein